MTSSKSPVCHIAIVGNVCVGKTSLFDRLCANGERSVNIPGSTLQVKKGILATGPGGASRAFRHQCASCGTRGMGRRAKQPPCCESDGARSRAAGFWEGCPALRESSFSRATSSSDTPIATHLYDTPGSATLAANSEDEMVARDLLLSGRIDSVVAVADATNLRRSLAFAVEVAQLGLPMLLDLNMLDEAEDMGVEVDDAALAREIGLPVVRTVASEGRGVRRLAEFILDPRPPKPLTSFPQSIQSGLDRLIDILDNPVLAPRGLALLFLSGDAAARSWLSEHLGEQTLEKAQAVRDELQASVTTPLKKLIADVFFAEAERIVDRVLVSTVRSPSALVRFGALAQRPLSGAIIGVGVLCLAYLWVGAFGATFVVDNLATHVFEGFLYPLFDKIVAPIPSAFVREAIMDPDFGLLPTGLFLAVGIVLPVLFCFYFLQAVLEDSGYLPRLAVLLDRLFRRIGLNGQGLIPLILGFSCITMAVITTRMLPSKKERIIMSLMLFLGIPCAPLLATMIVILNKMPWTAGAFVFATIALQVTIAGYVSSKLISGRLSDLIMELPKMRIPRPRVLWSKTWRRTWDFMREAVPIFLAASFAVFVFDRIGGLAVMERLAQPVVNGLLGLPDQAVQVFIKTAIRRENGAAELARLTDQFNNLQLIITMLVMVFLMPCINATIVLIKERGFKVSAAILGTVILWALTIGTVINMLFPSLGITFA